MRFIGGPIFERSALSISFPGVRVVIMEPFAADAIFIVELKSKTRRSTLGSNKLFEGFIPVFTKDNHFWE